MKHSIDIAPVMIYISSINGQCTYLNKKWFLYTGQTADYGIGSRWLEALHPDDKEKFDAVFRKACKTLEPFSLEVRIKNGRGDYRWHFNSGVPNFDFNERFKVFVGTIIDIHQRKQAENQLRESEHLFKTYVEVMPQMAFIADVEGNIIFYNQRWYEYIGGIKGTEGWGWKDKPIHHPDDFHIAVDRWALSLRTGEPYEIEYRLLHHEGQYRWHLGRATPIRNSEGNVELWLGTNTDIHSQKVTENELKDKEKKLLNANKALKYHNRQLKKANQLNENLLFIIAHDLTGPLANMSLIMDVIKNSDGRLKEQFSNSLRKMINLQRDILQEIVILLEAQQKENLVYTDIEFATVTQAVINEIDDNYLIIDCSFDKAPIITHVQDVIFVIIKNLIRSAIQFRHKQKKLRVDIATVHKDGYILLSVKSNGVGIDGKNIFTPKYKTDKDNGTLTDLYIIKSLIESSGGFIEIDSTSGEGSAINCYLKDYKLAL
jgi:PAS domain S-box-containing protein